MPIKINYQDPHSPVHNINLMTESLWDTARACLWTYSRFNRKKRDMILNTIEKELAPYRSTYEGYVSMAMAIFEMRRRFIAFDEAIPTNPEAWFINRNITPKGLPVRTESRKTRLYKTYALYKLPLAILSLNNNPTHREFETWTRLLIKRRGNHEMFIFLTVLAMKQVTQ